MAAVKAGPKGRLFFSVLAAIAGLGALLLVGAWFLVQSEWAEQRIERYLAGRLDRDVDFEGLRLAFGWPPRLELAALRIGNPQWAESPALVDASGIAMTVEVLPFFAGRLVADRLSVGRASVGLEREKGRATWRFGERDAAGDGGSRFALREVHVASADILYRDPVERTALHVHAQGTTGANGAVALQASGTYRGEKASAEARAPSLLLSTDQAIAVELEARIGAAHGSASGTLLASTSEPPSIDARIRLAAPGLQDLNGILPIDLPRSPPFEIEGRFVHGPGQWSLERFSGKVGDSDLAGSFRYDSRGARPVVDADLRSEVLDLDDLGPLLGAPPSTEPGETASAEQKRQAAKRQQAGKLLPSLPLGADRWDAIDAHVAYEVARIDSAPPSALQSLSVQADLQDGRLRLAPLELGVADGRVDGELELDARATPLHASLEAQVRGVQLARLFRKVRSQQAALGKLYGRARLEGTGASVAALLGSSDGTLTAAVEGGAVNALLVEAAGLDAAEALLVLGSKEHEQVPLNCAVVQFNVRDGKATAQTFVVDTRDTRVSVSGSIDLAAEQLDLVARPQPRDASPLSARSPIVIEGTLREPSLHPEGKALAARAGAAALLAIVNPLLALIPLIQPGKDVPSNCAQLLEEARAK